uniref:Syntaphilin n=1 Tax=Poecilia formosa TaxID=48698 RepID=A0A087XA67_POEFO
MRPTKGYTSTKSPTKGYTSTKSPDRRSTNSPSTPRSRRPPAAPSNRDHGNASVSSGSNSGSCKGSDCSPTKGRQKYTSCTDNHGIRPPPPEQYLTPLQQKEVCIRHLRAKLKETINTLQDRDTEIDTLRSKLYRMQEDWVEEECHRVEAQLALKEARQEIQQLKHAVDTVRTRLSDAGGLSGDVGVQKYFQDINTQNHKLENLLLNMEIAQAGLANRNCNDADFPCLSADGTQDSGFVCCGENSVPSRADLLLEAAYLSEETASLNTKVRQSEEEQQTVQSSVEGTEVLHEEVEQRKVCDLAGRMQGELNFAGCCGEDKQDDQRVEDKQQEAGIGERSTEETSPVITPEYTRLSPGAQEPQTSQPPRRSVSREEIAGVTVVEVHDEDDDEDKTNEQEATGVAVAEDEDSGKIQKSYWSRHFLIDLLAVAIPVVPTVAWLCRGPVRGGQPMYHFGSLLRGCCTVALHSLRRGGGLRHYPAG